MPGVRLSDAVAVLVSDLHLSHDPPRARAGGREAWYLTMENHLVEVLEAANTVTDFPIPLVIAGDVFHSWDQPVELVSWAAGVFDRYPDVPVMAVPGQHDLPYHSTAEYHRSALYNLEIAANGSAGRRGSSLSGGSRLFRVLHDRAIRLSSPTISNTMNGIDKWCLAAGGWGADVVSVVKTLWTDFPGHKTLVVDHKYVHDGGPTAHAGASFGSSVGTVVESVLEYADAVLYGDNHHPFIRHLGPTTPPTAVYNHGCLIRRTTKEREVIPEYGILLNSADVLRVVLLAAAGDVWADGKTEYAPPDKPAAADITGLAAAVRELTEERAVDFRAAVNLLIGDARLSARAKREILDLLDH